MAIVGFIGIGNMGSGMAANLLKHRHEVHAYDINVQALEQVEKIGAKIFPSVAEVVKATDVVITMLPAGEHVREVYASTDGVFANAKRGTLLVDSSTIDVSVARDIVKEAEEKGFEMVDAPVSGGIGGAQAGTLTFMVGGTSSAFERAKSLLSDMGNTVIHVGQRGNGQVAKICNNMLLGISMIGTCEAFNLARKLGLEPKTFYDVSSRSSGQNWSMTSYCPFAGVGPESPADRNFEAGFSADMMLKDLRLAKDAAMEIFTISELGSLSEKLFSDYVDANGGDKDFSDIVNFLNFFDSEEG